MEIHITLGIILLARLVHQSETANGNGRLEANSTYVALSGRRLELKWTYTGSKIYEHVSVFIPEDGPRSGNLKLWDLRYFPKNRTFSTSKFNVPSSIFNNLTEFRRETNSVFILIIKSVPRNISSFGFKCRLEFGSNWIVPIDKKISVRVAVKPSVVIPIKKGEEIDVPKGRDVDLRCRAAHGYPAPSIEWKKESNKLSSKLVARNEAVLTLINIQPVNAGRYVCTAKNMAGTHSADVVITVKYIEIKPGYTSSIKSSLGSLVDFSCPMDGYPPVMYSWFKGNNQLGQRSGLTVKIANEEDFGNYTCIGENGFGYRKVTFTVFGDPTSLPRNFRSGARWNKSNITIILALAMIFVWHFNQ